MRLGLKRVLQALLVRIKAGFNQQNTGVQTISKPTETAITKSLRREKLEGPTPLSEELVALASPLGDGAGANASSSDGLASAARGCEEDSAPFAAAAPGSAASASSRRLRVRGLACLTGAWTCGRRLASVSSFSRCSAEDSFGCASDGRCRTARPAGLSYAALGTEAGAKDEVAAKVVEETEESPGSVSAPRVLFSRELTAVRFLGSIASSEQGGPKHNWCIWAAPSQSLGRKTLSELDHRQARRVRGRARRRNPGAPQAVAEHNAISVQSPYSQSTGYTSTQATSSGLQGPPSTKLPVPMVALSLGMPKHRSGLAARRMGPLPFAGMVY